MLAKAWSVMPPKAASSGHKIGQIIGDWWEERVILRLLQDVADNLNLYLDCRFVQRTIRPGSKVLWKDDQGNNVDYDFVLEIGGTDTQLGTPVAFIESFWRRGSRHSKDKARDDTNKLLPMRATYPTARFLSIAACGEFTKPASEYVRTREVDLFLIPKSQIIEAFDAHQLVIDYHDQLSEVEKSVLAQNLIAKFSKETAIAVSDSLTQICGLAVMKGYSKRIIAALNALPVSIEISEARVSDVQLFDSVNVVDEFLKSPKFKYSNQDCNYKYSINYSDGSTFTTEYVQMAKLRRVHEMTKQYIDHMSQQHS